MKPDYTRILCFLTGAAVILIYILPSNITITRENSGLEWISALAFLSAAVLFFLAFLRSDKTLFRKRSWPLFALALLFFVAFGEEISWGQHYLNYNAPEFFEEHNRQNEVNIHNLPWFHQETESGDKKGGIAKFLTAKWLFTYFGVAYFFLFPLLTKRSQIVRQLGDAMRIPVPPVAIGILFVANVVLFRGIQEYFHRFVEMTEKAQIHLTHLLAEQMECCWAIIVLTLSIIFFLTTTSPIERDRARAKVMSTA